MKKKRSKDQCQHMRLDDLINALLKVQTRASRHATVTIGCYQTLDIHDGRYSGHIDVNELDTRLSKNGESGYVYDEEEETF